jgi:hypothetical protein
VEPVAHAFGRFGRCRSGPCGAADRHGCALLAQPLQSCPGDNRRGLGLVPWGLGGAMAMGPHPAIVIPDAA